MKKLFLLPLLTTTLLASASFANTCYLGYLPVDESGGDYLVQSQPSYFDAETIGVGTSGTDVWICDEYFNPNEGVGVTWQLVSIPPNGNPSECKVEGACTIGWVSGAEMYN